MHKSPHPYPFLEVQNVCDDLVREIVRGYKPGIDLRVSDDSPPNMIVGARVAMGSNVRSGIPTVHIYLREWVMAFYGMCNQDELLFETTFVLAFLHELTHLALGLVPQHDVPLDPEEMYVSEEIVCAKTCEIMELFVGAGRQLLPTDQAFHDAWIKCGRNKDTVSWKDFVGKRYSKNKS